MQDLRTFRRILYQIYHILNKKQRLQMAGLFVVILIGSILELLGVSAMLPFVQSIMDPIELMNKQYIRFFCRIFNVVDPSKLTIFVGVGIVLVYLLKNIYLSFSSYLQVTYSNRIQKELAVLMLQSYMDRPYSFFVENGSGIIFRGIQGDTSGVYQVILNGFRMISELLAIAALAIYLIVTDPILALGILAVGFFCILFITLLFKKKVSKMSTLFRNANATQFKWLVHISEGIKDIKVYCRQKYFLRHYRNASEDLRRAATYYTFISGLPERIIEAFCVIGIILTVLLRLKIGVNVDTFIPKMSVFAMGAFRLLPSISKTTGYLNTLVYYREWVESAYENIKTAERLRIEQIPEEPCSCNGMFQSILSIQNICWKYPESEENVLNDLSLDVYKGEAVGIVGESGSGKSTFADILLRLYHPQAGMILMDGTNIEEMAQSWSGIVGYVPQNVFLIDGTIRQNVTFGLEESSDDGVWRALEKASLDQFVKELPSGLDTIVGERGVKFSGGQRQRIAIARALYTGPQILILDEATSALDNETEEAVMEAIEALAGSITLIIIAHRVTTLRSCDKIYEIVNGKAVERDKKDVISYAIPRMQKMTDD